MKKVNFNNESVFCPIMGPYFASHDFMPIDLSVSNAKLPIFKSVDQMTEYIKEKLQCQSKKLAYGGYLERRNLYQSELFLSQGPVRDIHLGIDVWADYKTPIYCPQGGEIYGIAYNDNSLDYGHTIIIRHNGFYTLYGHMSHHVFEMWEVGEKIQKGQKIGYIGAPDENGGWSPHIHFQIIKDMKGNVSDYPGVCSEEDLDYYKLNCPNPIHFIVKD